MSSDAIVHQSSPATAVAGSSLAVLALRAAEQDVLVVLGEADIATASQLYEQLLRALPAPPRSVLVELGSLSFCDSSGLDALRDLEAAADTAGVRLCFRGQSAQLQWLQRTVPASGHRARRETCAAADPRLSAAEAPR